MYSNMNNMKYKNMKICENFHDISNILLVNY